MKRRSFLKILAGAACAVAAGIESALPNDTKPMVDVRPPKYEITPAWLNAPYEVGFLFSGDAYKRLRPKLGDVPEDQSWLDISFDTTPMVFEDGYLTRYKSKAA